MPYPKRGRGIKERGAEKKEKKKTKSRQKKGGGQMAV